MKQITFALLAAGILALPAGCTRQGAQDQEQEPQSQESVIPGEQDTMGEGAQEDPATMGEQPQDQQESVLPQDQQDPSMQPQDQQDPTLQPQDQPADQGMQPQGQ